MATAEKRLKGRIVSIPPNKYMLERPMLNGKKRLIGRIFSVRPNKFMLERLMFKGKKRLKGSVQPNILKGGKWRLKVEVEGEDNLMSKLPDEILVSIMCRLTTEEAGRMSVVSRRWLKIWKTSIRITPRLTFDMENRLGKGWLLSEGRESDLTYEMIDVVNGIVKLHEAPTLEEFTIGFYLSSLNSHHFNKWMDFAAKKHVKKLTLQFYPWLSYSSPRYEATFLADNYPMYWLRDLCIMGMHVTENAIQRLLSNSPFLERFSVYIGRRELLRLKMVCGSNLKYLRISGGHTLEQLEISAQNLNTMEMVTGVVPLQCLSISAPNLSHLILLVYRCFKFDDFSLTLLGQINRLALRIECELFMDEMSGPFLFPQFSKLHHLELIMTLSGKISFHHLPSLLEAASFLKTLSVECGRGYPVEENGLKWLDEHIPEEVKANQKQSCQYLKVVKFGNFAGCQYDIEFFLCLLEYAASVEKIIIQLMPSSAWTDNRGIINADQDQYEKLCLGCAQLLRTKVLQMHPSANVTIL